MSRTISLGQAHELIEILRKNGFDSRWAQRIIVNKDFAKRTADFIQRGGVELTSSQKIAKEIMGPNFLGPEAIARYFDIVLTNEQFKQVSEVPFSKQTIEHCKNTHLLCLMADTDNLGNQITINYLCKLFLRTATFTFYHYPRERECWFEHEEFAFRQTPQLGWCLIRKTITLRSRDKTFIEQKKLLSKWQYIERAVAYVYAIILNKLANGEELFSGNTAVNCADETTLPRSRVVVGPYYLEGLKIDRSYDAQCAHHIGIAPAIKPEI